MLELDRRDHRHLGVNDIRRIQPAPQTRFYDLGIASQSPEGAKGHKSGQFEVGRHLIAGKVGRLPALDQREYLFHRGYEDLFGNLLVRE